MFRKLLAAGFALVGCWGCQPDDTFRRVHSELAVNPDTLEFGDALLGAPSTLAVSARNTGDDILSLCVTGNKSAECEESTRVDPPNAPLRAMLEGLSEKGTWDVPRGATRQFLVTFTPAQVGPFAATLIIAHDGGNGPTTAIPVTGNGVVPDVSLSADSLDFGELAVGARKDLTLTISNLTRYKQPVELTVGPQTSFTFGTATAAGADAPYGEALKVDIPASGALDVKIWYRPQEEGSHQNTVTVKYCPDTPADASPSRPVCSKSVAVTGRGTKPVFELIPPALDFGSLSAGQESTRSFTVRNPGASELTVLSIEREADTSQEFTVIPSSPLPKLLAGGQEFRVDVRYQGVTTGEDRGRLLVTTDGWDDPNTTVLERNAIVALTAISVGPDITAVPPVLAFGTISVGNESSQIILIENAGNAVLNLQGIDLDVSTSNEITITNRPQLPRMLNPGESVTATLRYLPNGPGMDSGSILVRSNDYDEGMLSIPVNGVGGLPNVCTVAIAPNPVQFGLVPRGRTVQLPVRVASVGAQPCTLSNIRLSGAPEMQLISGGAQSVTLQTGEAHTLEVSYTPSAYASHTARIEFGSNDPGAPNVVVDVSGTSAPTDLLVVPPAVDFGIVPVNCRSPNRSVTLYNTGANNIRITDVRLDPSTSPEVELTPYLTPATLIAGGSSTLNLRYRPNAVGTDIGVLFISSDSTAVPIAVPLDGEGQVNPVQTDTFAQTPVPADVLFVIDNSCSMMEEQNGIGSNLSAFLGFAQGNGLDYQIAVTTTDVDASGEQGRFVGSTRVITPATSGASSIFQSNVSQGIYGATAEQGLEAAYLALSDPMINTWNAGFLRPEAALAIIIVSDEEDQSLRSRTFYENFFKSIKGPGNEGKVTFSGIVGTTNPECNSPTGIGDYAPRYIQTASGTGGVVESICNSNWAQALNNIGFTAFGLRRKFFLSSNPVVTTISVTVDGAATPSITAGGFQVWSYDGASNSVTFAQGAEPAANATISITYSVACLP